MSSYSENYCDFLRFLLFRNKAKNAGRSRKNAGMREISQNAGFPARLRDGWYLCGHRGNGRTDLLDFGELSPETVDLVLIQLMLLVGDLLGLFQRHWLTHQVILPLLRGRQLHRQQLTHLKQVSKVVLSKMYIGDAQSTENPFSTDFDHLFQSTDKFFIYGRIYGFFLTRFGLPPPRPHRTFETCGILCARKWTFSATTPLRRSDRLPKCQDLSEFRLGNPGACKDKKTQYKKFNYDEIMHLFITDVEAPLRRRVPSLSWEPP